jgi:hypothetical protein
MIGFKVENHSKHVNFDIQFQNCVFLGYHHAIVSPSKNIAISIENCMFKKQQYESILGVDLQYLKVKNSTFKKSTLMDSTKSCISLLVNDNSGAKDAIDV